MGNPEDLGRPEELFGLGFGKISFSRDRVGFDKACSGVSLDSDFILGEGGVPH